MICQSCGTQLQEEDRFCPSCGTPRSNSTSPQTSGDLTNIDQAWETSPPQSIQQNPARPISSPERRSYANPNQHDDYRLMGAYGRSFTTPAVITLVLYFVLWIPGFIANIVYLLEANKVEKLTGEAPEGKGCLLSMLVLFSLFFLLGCVMWLVIIGAIGASGSSS